MHPNTLVAAAALAALVLAGCAGADDAPPAADSALAGTGRTAAGPVAVTMTATDYAFDTPGELGAGLVTFELRNEGAEIHHAQLLRINQGGSLEEALAALETEDFETLSANVALVGGVGIVAPGSTAAATLDLAPGRYAFFCGIPSEDDGVPHFVKGMVTPFTVTGAAPDQAPVETVGEVVLTDFAFGLPDDLDGTVAVTNRGEQLHELLLIRLREGVTLEEGLASMEGPPPADGPPPAIPAGGMQALMPGDTGYLDLGALAPGTYGLVCVIPDAATGQPHFALGMVAQIQVEG